MHEALENISGAQAPQVVSLLVQLILDEKIAARIDGIEATCRTYQHRVETGSLLLKYQPYFKP